MRQSLRLPQAIRRNMEHRPTPVGEEHRKGILQAVDVAEAVLFVASLPPRAAVPELIIAPSGYQYV